MTTPSLTHKKLLSSSAALLSARIFGIGVTFATLGLLSKRLTQHKVTHVYEEFDDTHSSIDYRMDVSLPYLYRALKP
jgi:hypothetical protein